MKTGLKNNCFRTLARVFAALLMLASGGHALAETVTDVITLSTTGVNTNSYASFSDKTDTSSAVYAGNCMKQGTSTLQLRASSSSGIVSTASGGFVKKITVDWSSNTDKGNTLDVYGKNTAYTSAANLYTTDKGIQLGSITYGTSTTLEVDGNYAYIGLRSKSNTLHIKSITIEWENNQTTVAFSEAVMAADVPFVTSPVTATFAKGEGTSAPLRDADEAAVNFYAGNILFVSAPEGYAISGIALNCAAAPSLGCDVGTCSTEGKTGVMLTGAEGTYSVYSCDGLTAEAPGTNWLKGATTDTPAIKGTYVLQQNNGIVAFYLVAQESITTVTEGKAYLDPGSPTVKAFFFNGEDARASAIRTVQDEGTAATETIYTLGGQKTTHPQRGINILRRADGKTLKRLQR